jgi:glycosyltransferase involved in cell wall biosynthesis
MPDNEQSVGQYRAGTVTGNLKGPLLENEGDQVEAVPSSKESGMKLHRQYMEKKLYLTWSLLHTLELRRQAILCSMRWKLGDGLIRLVERILGRKPHNLAIHQLQDDIERLRSNLEDLLYCTPLSGDFRSRLLVPGRSPKAWFEGQQQTNAGLVIPPGTLRIKLEFLPASEGTQRLNITIILPSTNIHGGTRRLLSLTRYLMLRGHQVNLYRQRPGPPPAWFDPALQVSDLFFDRDTKLSDLEAVLPDADVLLTYGNNPLNDKLNGLPQTKGRQYALFMHFGVHDRELDIRNARLESVRPLATSAWIADQVRLSRGTGEVPLIGFGVDNDRLYPESGQRTFSIGTLYNPADWKRNHLVMEAWRRLRKIKGYESLRLVMFGQVETEFQEEGIDYFFDPPQSEIRYIYSACSVWITASISEGLGMSGVEAMLCQTPLITTFTGGSAEFCRPDNCLIIKSDSVHSIVNGVLYLFDNPDTAAKLAHQAYADILEHTWTRSIARLEAVFLHANHGIDVR